MNDGVMAVVKTISQILTAGLAITSFSLLLFGLSFNLRDRVARVFALVMVCMVVVFTAEAMGSTSVEEQGISIWLHIQWVGIILLPAIYLHFSDAILTITGKPSRGRRRLAVIITYLLSSIFVGLSFFPFFVGKLVIVGVPAANFTPTLLTDIFIVLYLACMGVVWVNFYRAYRRTVTETGRRRMSYLILGALAPMLGSFPFLMFGSDIAANNPLIFWLISVLNNMVVGGLMVVMAYSVSFFGVSWPDRVIKIRLLKWILRGPVTASLTLGLATIVRRIGEANGISYSAWVPIVTVATIVLCEFLITIVAPLIERYFFYGNDRSDLELLHMLEERLVTEKDLRQFLELVLATICDRLQAKGAVIAEMDEGKLTTFLETGKVAKDYDLSEILTSVSGNLNNPDVIQQGEDTILYPVSRDNNEGNGQELLGALVIYGLVEPLDGEKLSALKLLSQRIALALRDRRTQKQVFHTLQNLTSQESLIQRMRATGSYDDSFLLREEMMPDPDLVQWVREALNHYWGGPKLMDNPLMRFNIVEKALKAQNGNHSNALRAVLREAVERVKPVGEKHYTNEWILYNILEMKFLEGRKVKEIAIKLAVSEADLYRKQRVAIEAVAQAILEMEDREMKQIDTT
jgi:RsiW-degrading membrane proteinase PrsW (M82 family)